MRKILIDDTITGYAEKYYTQLCDGTIKTRIVADLDNLITEIKQDNPANILGYINYLRFIRLNLRELILLRPDQFEPLQERLQKKWKCVLSWKRTPNGASFADRVVKALHYGDIRKDIFPRYVQKLGIKTCVYCNTQYALTTGTEDGGKLSAYYELDHAYPKADFPFLAVSFFNLQPSCGPCNRRKSDIGKPYSIYVEKPTESSVCISIDNKSLVNYILNHKREDLQVVVTTQNPNLNKLYKQIGVYKIYSELRDEAEDMVWKAKIYNESYFKQLYSSYGRSPLNTKSSIYRLLYGIYDGEEYVYTRPLTKMKQDIAKQLKLI